MVPFKFRQVFDSLEVSYKDGKNRFLKDVVSFTARQGQVTALVGPSGRRKIYQCKEKLAARFRDIDRGKVTLGAGYQRDRMETLLRSFSIVFQDVVLLLRTIMENILASGT